MGKGYSIFGWKSAFRSYTKRDLAKDSLFPVIIAILITLLSYFCGKNMVVELFKIVNVGLSVTPAMMSILLAAYAILMSMYWSPICEKMKHSEKGNKLLNEINSSFAIAIKVICLGVLYLLLISSIGIVNLPFEIMNPNIVNALLFAIALYFMLFSIWIIKDIALNIYNLASFNVNTEIKEKPNKEKEVQK